MKSRYIFTLGRLAGAGLIVILMGVVMGFAGAQEYLEPDLPDVATLRDVRLQLPLRIYSRDGRLMGQFGEQRRKPLAREDIPEILVQAVLAAEDDGFYQHGGVDLFGFTRAVLRDVFLGKAEGGGTITMQLTRGVFFTREKTVRRKLMEIFSAWRIEKQFSKDEILTLYLNKFFLGQRAYGVGAAAEVYFGKNVDQLSIAEAALIAATFQEPSEENPVASPERARQRRAYVLRRLKEKNYISQEQYDEAIASPVESKLHAPTIELDAPYVAEMVRLEMLNRVGPAALSDGYIAVTTIDSRLQRAAVDAVRAGLVEYDQRHGYRGPLARGIAVTGASEKDWQAALDDYPTRAGLTPAVIVAVNEQHASAYTAEFGTVVLGFPTMRWARTALPDGNVGNPVERPADVLQVGDIVHVAQDMAGTWHLVQQPVAQGAFVALDPSDGAVSALVGGFDYGTSNFNRVVQAKRQPGSSFKPFLYSAALEHGYTAATLINDAPIVFEDVALEGVWRPKNITGTSLGPVRMREALYKSLNQVSIRIMHSLGPAYASEYIRRFGFSADELPPNLSLALGTTQVSPLRMAASYAVFANGGYRVEPYFVDRIKDPNGATIYTAAPKQVCSECAQESGAGRFAPQAISPQNAHLMNDMLMDVVRRGTATRALTLKRADLAGKTGTSQDLRDTWFCGYNTSLVGVVWVGFDEEKPLGPGEQGGRTALPIWIKFMAEAVRGLPERRLPTPPGLETRLISTVTGKPARPGDPNAVFETFIAGQVPEADANDSVEPPPQEEQEKPDDSLF